MKNENLQNQAMNNMLALSRNPYPGRGIVIGIDQTEKYLVQIYWIMGRSANSRNRIFVEYLNGVLKTAPANPAEVKDPSLIIYTAMMEEAGSYVVSNGHQTEDALKEMRAGDPLVLGNWMYEPDKPNFTPRITAAFPHYNTPGAQISIITKSYPSDDPIRITYGFADLEPGLGFCVTTYKGDGDPLPSFEGDPYILPIMGGAKEVAEMFWSNLNEDNKVSLAVKFINRESGESYIHIINKHKYISG